MKYLYFIWQDSTGEMYTYDSAVVVAESEDEAKRIHPNYMINDDTKVSILADNDKEDLTWTYFENVKVKKIGIADESQYNEKVICASYNAG